MRKTPGRLRGILAALNFVLLCILLTAGLWPFHAPANDLTWLPGGGVDFGEHSTIVGAGGYLPASTPTGEDCTVEIWLQPLDITSGSTLLTFDAPQARHFALRQSDPDLELRAGATKFFLNRFFRANQPAFITITSDANGTHVYRDGVFIQTFSQTLLSRADFAGRLILGNSLEQKDNFSGRLRGLALYGNALSPAQIDADYDMWTQSGHPQTQSPLALYLFHEGRGSIIHDAGTSGTNLNIPAHFVVVHQKFLERPWTEFHHDWNYLKDLLINIFGFVPWGFFVLAWLATRPTKHPVLLTVLPGFAVSLTIEVLQSFLPTRYSGITDLFTNTFGTWIGTVLYRWVMRHPHLIPEFRA